MFKISRNLSVLLSQVLCAVLIVLLVAGFFITPILLRFVMDVYQKPDYIFIPCIIILYAGLLLAAVVLVSLFMLLRKVSEGVVFTDSNVAHVRRISWCCIAESVIYLSFGFVLGSYRLTSAGISLAMLFIGLIVRVVKNILEEAVALKNENDFTI